MIKRPTESQESVQPVRRIRLVALGAVIGLVGYASLLAPRPTVPDITTAVVLDAGRPVAFQVAMESLLDHGFTPVAGTPEQGFVAGERGVSGWSWGERVGVYLSGRAEGPTFLRVVSGARLVTNLTAPDWTARIMADLAARAADPGGPGAGRAAGAASTAACFAVSAEGRLLTAYHVIADASEIVVELADGRSLVATIDQTAEALDLAVLKVPGPTPEFLTLAKAGRLRVGDPVFSFGFPAPSLAEGEPWYATATVRALAGPSDELSLLQITMPARPRDTGGPLLNAHGEVVGVITTAAVPIPFLDPADAPPQDLSWAVKIEFARPLLGQAPRPPRPAGDQSDAIERARKALCLVKASAQALREVAD